MWMRLNNLADWEQHKAEFVTSHSIQQQLVSWGSPPVEYPCLVDSMAISPVKIVSAFVYRDDAVKLIPVPKQAQAQQAMQSDPQAQASAVPGHTWKDFADGTTANLLTVIHFMVETGICTREKFEEVHTMFVHNVEQWSAEDRDVALSKITGAIPPPQQQD